MSFALKSIGLAGPVLVIGLVSAPVAFAASNYVENWDAGASLAGWMANSIDADASNPGSDGNPNTGGYLRSTLVAAPLGSEIGATTELAAATGDFGGLTWTASVDLAQFQGSIDKVWLRFRYANASNNGWRFLLNEGSPGDGWSIRTVDFNAAWTDTEAMFAGWEKEAGPNASFAATLADVYRTEVRFSGTGSLAVGIDNFSLVAVTAVPEPATYGMLALGLATVAGLSRRLRSR